METAAVPQPWGRRFLRCPPDHYEVSYAINPWMRTGTTVDPDRAREQWDALGRALVAAGACLEVLEPVPGLPDLVFTANAGVVDGDRFVPSRFLAAERRGETTHDESWFAGHGYAVEHLPAGLVHEGAGDALPFTGPDGRPVLVGGHGPRTRAAAQQALSTVLDVPIVPVTLLDPRLYHLDLTFCPLDDRRALVAPDAWDRASARAVAELVPEPLELSLDEAMRFTANAVVVGRTIVLPACPPRVGRRLERWGFDVVEVDVGEFQKSGGACRCLTLALDVDLHRDLTRPPTGS